MTPFGVLVGRRPTLRHSRHCEQKRSFCVAISPLRRTDLTVSGSLKKGFFGGLEIHPTKKGQTMDKKNTARKSLRITLGTFAVIFILLTLMALFADIFPIIGDWFKFIALFFKTLFGALFS